MHRKKPNHLSSTARSATQDSPCTRCQNTAPLPSPRIARTLLPVVSTLRRDPKAAANLFRQRAAHRAPRAPPLLSAPRVSTALDSHSSRDLYPELPQATAAAPELPARAAPFPVLSEIFPENQTTCGSNGFIPRV